LTLPMLTSANSYCACWRSDSLPGERVCVIAQGFPGHDPLAVRIGHTTFALRRYEAALIRVVPEQSLARGAR
jgi:hypothetical protein